MLISEQNITFVTEKNIENATGMNIPWLPRTLLRDKHKGQRNAGHPKLG